KLALGMRNVRAKGAPSGLNQTSANGSPLYFKAAQWFEGGCSEKFTPHLLPSQNQPPRQQGGTCRSPGLLCVALASHSNAEPGRGKDGWWGAAGLARIHSSFGRTATPCPPEWGYYPRTPRQPTNERTHAHRQGRTARRSVPGGSPCSGSPAA